MDEQTAEVMFEVGREELNCFSLPR